MHPELDEAECLDQVASLRSFGIATLAQALAATVDDHDSDVPLMGALIGHGSVECGGDDRWKLQSSTGFVDRYVAAYNVFKAISSDAPACSKRIAVTVALYTGLDTPGQDGVAAAKGC